MYSSTGRKNGTFGYNPGKGGSYPFKLELWISTDLRSMGGVGDVLAPKLIAEIGDVRRLHNAKALIAWAGIDPPPYESGQFVGSQRRITKRGSSTLRKVGYEVMRVLKSHREPEDNVVYNYILKKEAEGKSKKAAKIAGLNKFLRIYYARVMAVYQQQ